MKGFFIHLRLRVTAISGVDAVDTCRRLGFFDRSQITTREYPATSIEIEDEKFIRAWFDPEEITSAVQIDLDWLTADDVALTEHGVMELRQDISVKRAKQLYIRARFDTLSEIIKELAGALDDQDERTEENKG